MAICCTKQGVGPSGGHRSPNTSDTTKEASVRDSVADTKADPSGVRRIERTASSKLPWILLSIVLVLAAAAAGLYLGGIVKL